MILFSICIPTYNRRELLERNLRHLELQNFEKNKYEVIIVDDGSIDDTEQFVKEYSKVSELNIRYHKKENGGKFTALRYAIANAKGYFFINNDSDDYLHEQCLSNISKLWFETDEAERENLAGIIGHNINMATDKIVGDLFPVNVKFSDPIEMRFKFRINGDKFPCIRLDIMKRFQFPEATKTVFIPESYVFYGITSKFEFLYTNIALQYCEYQTTGLTNNIKKYRLKNALGCYLAYQRYIDLIEPKKTYYGYLRNSINYVRFSFHAKRSRKFSQISLLNPVALAAGYFYFLIDKIKQ